MLEPKDSPGTFQLATGTDYIEIVVKTVDMGDSQTPSTTMAGPNNLTISGHARNNRNSGRRGTVMANVPFIPESPSSGVQQQVSTAPGSLTESGGSSRFSFAGLS